MLPILLLSLACQVPDSGPPSAIDDGPPAVTSELPLLAEGPSLYLRRASVRLARQTALDPPAAGPASSPESPAVEPQHRPKAAKEHAAGCSAECREYCGDNCPCHTALKVATRPLEMPPVPPKSPPASAPVTYYQPAYYQQPTYYYPPTTYAAQGGCYVNAAGQTVCPTGTGYVRERRGLFGGFFRR